MKTLLLITFIFCINISYAKEKGKTPPPGYVGVSQDNSAIENEIYSYIRHVYYLTGIKKCKNKKNDLFLIYNIQLNDSHKTEVSIYARPSLVEKGKVVSSEISIRSYIIIPAQLRNDTGIKKILEFNQKFMRDNITSPTIYVKRRKVIFLRYTIDIPSSNTFIPIDSVYAHMLRMAETSRIYSNMLCKQFNIPKTHTSDNSKKILRGNDNAYLFLVCLLIFVQLQRDPLRTGKE